MYNNFCKLISGTLTGSLNDEHDAFCLRSCESEPEEGCRNVSVRSTYMNTSCFETCKDLGSALYYLTINERVTSQST